MKIERKDTAVVIADDEPFNLSFLFDFVRSQGLTVELDETVDDALYRLQQARYRLVIVDLNLPYITPTHDHPPGDIRNRFPGLCVAEFARNQGHTGRQVILYTVHDLPEVERWAKAMGVTYLPKGRPSIRDEIRDVLRHDPF